MPIWLIIIIVSRDIAIFGAVIISWMLDTNLKIEPLIVSKINTFLQIFYITLTIATVLNTNYLISFQNIAFIGTTYLIAFTTIVSWLSYLRIWLLNMNVINNE